MEVSYNHVSGQNDTFDTELNHGPFGFQNISLGISYSLIS